MSVFINGAGVEAAIVSGGNVPLGLAYTDSPSTPLPYRNVTGQALTPGQVVIFDTAGAETVNFGSGNARWPMVVVIGGAYLGTVWCAADGQKADVIISGSVTLGDQLVMASNGFQASADNTETDPSRILGVALASAASGTIPMRVGPYPTLRPQTPGTVRPLAFPVTNRTGGSLIAGDCCRLSSANDSSVIANSGAAQTGACVVVYGGADTATVWVAQCGVASVLCTTVAVARRDILQLSATAKQAETTATPTAGATIGFALTAKGAGSAGLVTAVIGPSL